MTKRYAYIAATVIILSLAGTVIHTFKQNGKLKAQNKQWADNYSQLDTLRQKEGVNRQIADQTLVANSKAHAVERENLKNEIKELSRVDTDWRDSLVPADTTIRLLDYARAGPDYLQATSRGAEPIASADTRAFTLEHARLADGNIELRTALRACNKDKADALGLYIGAKK